MTIVKPTDAAKVPMSFKIAQYVKNNPTAKAADVAVAVGSTTPYVYVVMSKMKGKAKKTKPTPAQRAEAIRLKMAKVEGSKKMVRVYTTDSNQSITAHVDQITNLTPEQTERLVYNLSKGRTRMQGGVTAQMLKDTATSMQNEKTDNVNHPAHYKVGGIETIDYIEAKLTPEEFRGYLKGNVLKYLSRAGNKGNYEEDLLKARWYMNREIAKFAK